VAEKRAVDLQQLSKDWAQSVAHWATPEISPGGSYELGGAQYQLKPHVDCGLWTTALLPAHTTTYFFTSFIYPQWFRDSPAP
jgi:hypothetical protein